ncbi:MAG TPA: DUF1330 domain-containing protein [Ferruginibacter sp.]|nr:DUF1330 domain-containing protein [Ferruginibacter sp.]
MSAYIIVDVTVFNEEEYAAYKSLTPGSIAPFHGKFIIRGGKTETIEGDWKPQRIVVVEFPTADLARQWWSSPEYTKAKAIRHRTAHSKMILVEGV